MKSLAICLETSSWIKNQKIFLVDLCPVTDLINGLGLVVISREDVQELSIGLWVTALLDLLHVLHSRFNCLWGLGTIWPTRFRGSRWCRVVVICDCPQ